MSCVPSLGITQELSSCGSSAAAVEINSPIPRPSREKKKKKGIETKKNELGFKRVNVAMNAKVHGGMSGFIYTRMCVCVCVCQKNES